MFQNKKAQSIGEYVIVVTLVITALSVMQLYMKRGIQAAVKIAADELAPQQRGDIPLNLAKVGALVDEKTSIREIENANKKELPASIKRYLSNTETQSNSISTYVEGQTKGEFSQ